MTSNIQFVSETAGSIPVASAPGKVRLFRDVADGLLKFKDDTGAVFQIAGTQDYKDAVRVASAAALPAYTRVSNTITANANGALPAIDGVTLLVNNSFLYVSGSGITERDNGLWVVTQVGSGGSPFVLTRRGDATASSQFSPGMVVPTGPEGATTGSQLFILATPDPITLNTTALAFEAISGGGGGFSLTEIDSSSSVPENQSMLYSDDVVIVDGGDLALDGDITPVREEDNFSVNFIPQRSIRVVQENDQMLFTDSMRIDGDLIVDGDIIDATPYDGNDILAALTAVAPNTPSILGVASPASFLSPAQARTVMDVPSVAQMAAAIAAGGSGLTFAPGIQNANFDALPGFIYIWDCNATLDATLPAAPDDNARIGFYGDPSNGVTGELEVEGEPNTMLFPGGAGEYELQGGALFSIAIFQFRQTGGPGVGYWALVNGDYALQSMASLGGSAIPTTTEANVYAPLAVAANSVVGRTGSGDITSIPISSLGSGLTQDPVVKTASFTAAANTSYYVEGWPSGDKAVELPGSPTLGDRVVVMGLDAAGLALLRVWSANEAVEVGFYNGGNGFGNGPTVNCRGAHLDMLYCNVSGSSRWRDTGNGLNTAFVNSGGLIFPHSVLTSDANGAPIPAEISDDNFVARTGGSIGTLSPTDARALIFPTQVFVDAAVNTGGGETTTIYTFTTAAAPNGNSIVFKIQVQGVAPGANNVALFDISAIAYRTSVGTVTIEDLVFLNGPYKGASITGSDVTFNISGSDIEVQVTGQGGFSIFWRVTGVVVEHIG